MKLSELCLKTKIKYPPSLADTEITGITSNSKKVRKGNLFVCLSGLGHDGHRYIDEAFINGAAAAVIENKKYECTRSVTVRDTREALANLMNVICGEPTKELKLIAVTGTNGKTSVSVMIKHIFETKKIPCEVIGTLNCSSFSPKIDATSANFTTPDPEELYPMLRRISDAGVQYVVMETSSHALKLKKLAPIKFEIAIFTNLTEDHLDFHCDMEDYFKSKLSVFDSAKLGIINIDDSYGKRIKNLAPCEILTCSQVSKSDFSAESIKVLDDGSNEYELRSGFSDFKIKCPVPGSFSVMNSLQASACALAIGFEDTDIQKAFETFRGVRGRFDKIDLSLSSPIRAYIDYAHTPDALQKTLDTANAMKGGGRVIVLFGCGGEREKEKRKIMGEIAVREADVCIITSDNPRGESPNSIINDILSGVGERENYAVIPKRALAIEYAFASAKAGDIILLCGKGHENYEINKSGRVPFDESAIAKEAYNKYFWNNNQEKEV